MKIVITGGLGFIFSHVTDYFLERGDEVHVIDAALEGSHPELIPEWKRKYQTFEMHVKDVSYQAVVPLIVRINPDYIIHAAAISDVDYSIDFPLKTIASNNNATINVFEAARKCKNLKKLLYISTDEVYGECDHPKTEDEIIWPKNPYALSKAFGSITRIAYDNTYPELKDKTCETRFCNVFGPRQDDRKVIPAIKRALSGGKPLILHNSGTGYRQYIHVSEIPRVVETILERGNRTYNITSGFGCTVSEIIALAENITGKKVPVITGKRLGMDMRYEMSASRLVSDLNWSPLKSFTDGLESYLQS